MTTHLTRWPVAVAALDALRASPYTAGVQIEEAFPGVDSKPELIYLDEITGEIEYPNMSGPDRAQRDETFEIPLQIRVQLQDTPSVTRDRVEELLAIVEDVFADFTVAVFTAIPNLLSLEVAEPVSTVADTPAGTYGFARIDLIGKSRLS